MDCDLIVRLTFSRTLHTTLRTLEGGGVVFDCFVLCVCFGNMCNSIYVLIHIYIYIYIYIYLFLFVTSVRNTATELNLNCGN
jgi:hypothetical protein